MIMYIYIYTFTGHVQVSTGSIRSGLLRMTFVNRTASQAIGQGLEASLSQHLSDVCWF